MYLHTKCLYKELDSPQEYTIEKPLQFNLETTHKILEDLSSNNDDDDGIFSSKMVMVYMQLK